MRWLILIPVLVSFLTGCAFLESRFAQKPKVTLQKVYVRDANFLAATMVFVMHVENPNKISLDVDQLDYDIQLGGQPFAQGTSQPQVKVPAEGAADVEIPMKFEYLKILQNLQQALQGQAVAYIASGKVKVSGFSIPFSEKGEINLKN